MNRVFLAGMCLLLANCSFAPTKDNRQWAELTCSGFTPWRGCWETAIKLCPQGYDIADQEENLFIQKRIVKISCKGETLKSLN